MATLPSSFTEVIDDELLDSDTVKTREERLEVLLPVRLIRSSIGGPTEVIPAVLVNVSASGVQILTDQRFSLFLPPFLGARFAVEFFIGEIEIRHVVVEIVRSEKRDPYRIVLGGKFVNLPSEARLSLRSAVASQARTARR
ncbi:MAG: PilZ domain-containing protein [Candidatus Binatia bacterium]